MYILLKMIICSNVRYKQNSEIIYKPITKCKYISNTLFNKLPIELIKNIRKYIGITSFDILTVYNELKTKNIKWTIYEQPTSNINTFFTGDPKK
jgi:hypothetical protein